MRARGAALTANRRSRARRGEGERLRDDILAAATRLLDETGDESAVSIRAVADAVGVTPPSIYLHFADKNTLLFEVCAVLFQQLDQAMQAAVGDLVDPLDRLRARGEAYIAFGLAHPEQYRILFMHPPRGQPPGFDVGEFLTDSGFGHLIADCTRAIEEGVAEGDALLLSTSLWAACHGLTSLLIAKPDFPWPDRQQLLDYHFATGMDGFRRDPPDQRR